MALIAKPVAELPKVGREIDPATVAKGREVLSIDGVLAGTNSATDGTAYTVTMSADGKTKLSASDAVKASKNAANNIGQQYRRGTENALNEDKVTGKVVRVRVINEGDDKAPAFHWYLTIADKPADKPAETTAETAPEATATTETTAPSEAAPVTA